MLPRPSTRHPVTRQSHSRPNSQALTKKGFADQVKIWLPKKIDGSSFIVVYHHVPHETTVYHVHPCTITPFSDTPSFALPSPEHVHGSQVVQVQSAWHEEACAQCCCTPAQLGTPHFPSTGWQVGWVSV